MRLVIDASVSVKWFFADSEREQDAAIALDILEFVHNEIYTFVQPVHWPVDVFAVEVRKSLLRKPSYAPQKLFTL